MPKFDVWRDGYALNGDGRTAPALMHEGVEAPTFKEACIQAFKDDRTFDADRLAFWGCGLHPSREELLGPYERVLGSDEQDTGERQMRVTFMKGSKTILRVESWNGMAVPTVGMEIPIAEVKTVKGKEEQGLFTVYRVDRVHSRLELRDIIYIDGVAIPGSGFIGELTVFVQ